LVSRILRVVLVVFCLVITNSSNVFARPVDDMLSNGVGRNDMDMVKMAVDNGANVNYKRDIYVQSPVHVAIDHKNIDMILYLCQKGALIDVGTIGNGFNKKTELIHAAEVDSLDLVKLFVEVGEKVNAADINGNTPLMTALKSYSSRPSILEMVNYLISVKANVNQANNDRYTPLMAVANTYSNNNVEINIEIAKTLLAAGADLSKKDISGNTALQYAVNNNNKEMINLLLPISPK